MLKLKGTRGRRNARIGDNNHLNSAVSITVPAVAQFPFSNALNGKDRGKLWKPGTKTFNIQIDLGLNKQCSFFALFGEADKILKFSDAAIVRIKANALNLFTGGEPFSITVPITDRGIFADLTTDEFRTGQQYRHWRIEIDDSTNPLDLDASYLFLGDHVDFQFNVNQGFQFRQSDLSRRQTSDAGMIYSARKNQFRLFSAMGFSFLDEDDRYEIERTAERLGLTTPWVFVLDPEEVGFDLEFGTLLCYWDELPAYTHAYLNKFNLQFGIREVV